MASISLSLPLHFSTAFNEDEYSSGSSDIKYSGYTYDNNPQCTVEKPCVSDHQESDFQKTYNGIDSTIKQYLENWYIQNLTEQNEKITLTYFCTSNVENTFKCSNPSENYGGVIN